MEITIKNIEKSIKKILGDSDILNSDSVYEHIDGSDNLKLVIFINKMFGENTILYTKLIFKVNNGKTKLINNSFLYLYDINCQYVNVDFSDINDFEKKLKSIFHNNKFGPDLKILSDFIEKPAFLINDWFKKNHINEINVSNVKYEPKAYIIPCKSLFFPFIISANNIDIPFSIKKEHSEYMLSFQINSETINVELNNLKNLIQNIGITIKNKLK
ncbi:MAG: hypothetical protein HPY57_13880 [Ignavibacteria bacterium]|nr:hypothetical protein [Ignavibacteria bacterium]